MNDPGPGTVFPTEVDELTPAVLGAALAERHPGNVVEGLEVVAGGIAGTPAELRAWMPGAMAVFTFSLRTPPPTRSASPGRTPRPAAPTCSTATAWCGTANRRSSTCPRSTTTPTGGSATPGGSPAAVSRRCASPAAAAAPGDPDL